MKKVYFIAGLGADGRSFGFLDLSFCEPQFVQWITPAPGETLASYAEKLFQTINDENATIVGLSFGGMLATEIAKKHPGTNVILISSAKTYLEIPRYLRVWRHFPVYRMHTQKMQQYTGSFVLNLLGARGIEQKKVQQQILKEGNAAFTRWAMNAIVNWKNMEIPKNITHIHGTADTLLPYRYVKADHTIQRGAHVMIMDMADEVSKLLKQLITA